MYTCNHCSYMIQLCWGIRERKENNNWAERGSFSITWLIWWLQWGYKRSIELGEVCLPCKQHICGQAKSIGLHLQRLHNAGLKELGEQLDAAHRSHVCGHSLQECLLTLACPWVSALCTSSSDSSSSGTFSPPHSIPLTTASISRQQWDWKRLVSCKSVLLY